MVGSEYLCDLKGVLARPPLEPIWIRRACETIGPASRIYSYLFVQQWSWATGA